jgi:hypothetical protein
MTWTREHLGIGALALVLTAGCGAAGDAYARQGECQSTDRHLERCGILFDDGNICSANKEGLVRPELSEDQAECIKRQDCTELRHKAEDGRVCGVNVKWRDPPKEPGQPR